MHEKKKTKRLVDEKLNTTQQCALSSPVSQQCPVLHQKKCGQQGEGGDSPPLFCSPGVIHPALEPPAQGYGTAGAGAKVHRDDQRAGVHLL